MRWPDRLAGFLISGIRETQEMLDFCAQLDPGAEIEVVGTDRVGADRVSEACERVLASHVRYRFVIITSTLDWGATRSAARVTGRRTGPTPTAKRAIPRRGGPDGRRRRGRGPAHLGPLRSTQHQPRPRTRTMTWTSEELTRIGNAEVLQVSSRRRDGTLRPYVTIWVVRADRDLYIRSAYGPDNPWFRRARASGAGRIRAGGVERDVTFEKPVSDVNAAVDAAYHAKYDRHGPAIVGTVVGERAAATTIRLLPHIP